MENEEINIASSIINTIPAHKIIWLGLLLGLGVAGIIIKAFIKIPTYYYLDRPE